MSVRIGLNIVTYPFASTKGFWRWVDLCEENDIDSLWQTDRLVSTLPFLESMTTMAALAGGTERLKFGMNVVVVTFRDPLVLAKQCATIDFLSDGRLLPAFGVGGPVAPEWEATGRTTRKRGAIANEALEIMARLWVEERVTYEGAHFQYRNARIEPKPVQQPLPLWIGGISEAAIRRTARLGNGWLGGLQTPETAGQVVAAIKTAAAEEGRAIDEDHYGASFPFYFGPWDAPAVQSSLGLYRREDISWDPPDYFAVGDAGTILGRIRAYMDQGISKFVMRPLGDSEGEIMAQTKRLVEEVVPLVHGAPVAAGNAGA